MSYRLEALNFRLATGICAKSSTKPILNMPAGIFVITMPALFINERTLGVFFGREREEQAHDTAAMANIAPVSTDMLVFPSLENMASPKVFNPNFTPLCKKKGKARQGKVYC